MCNGVMSVVMILRKKMYQHLNICSFLTFPFLADIIILAEHTLEVTVCKENGARALPPSQAVLFTKVREVRADSTLDACVTLAQLAGCSVVQASPATAHTFLQLFNSFIFIYNWHHYLQLILWAIKWGLCIAPRICKVVHTCSQLHGNIVRLLISYCEISWDTAA